MWAIYRTGMAVPSCFAMNSRKGNVRDKMGMVSLDETRLHVNHFRKELGFCRRSSVDWDAI